jgi:RNA polymerase sigma-70 factor (ECF subfamily)
MNQKQLHSKNKLILKNVKAPYQEVESNSTTMINDEELFLKRIFDENPEKGVELLYRRYFQPLCSHAMKFIGSKTIAEDLVSEVFYEFYKSKAFSKIQTSFRFYLFRSVRNRAYNFLKSELKMTDYFEEKHDITFSEGENPESISQFEEMYQDVQNAVNTLPIERRKIYLMNRFEGKRYQEIADELKLSVKTIEVQLYRSNKHIRALLKGKWMLSLIILLLCK